MSASAHLGFVLGELPDKNLSRLDDRSPRLSAQSKVQGEKRNEYAVSPKGLYRQG
jgi:hypothetical protein